jgi:hypothetical protein
LARAAPSCPRAGRRLNLGWVLAGPLLAARARHTIAMRVASTVMADPTRQPATVRGSITAAQQALTEAQPEGKIFVALAALEHAIDLLDTSDRQMGAFRGAEPYLLILDPLRQDEPSW